MKKLFRSFTLLFFLFKAFTGLAQEKSDNICYVNDNRMYIQLDDRWTDARKKEIAGLYNLDSIIVEQAFAGKILTSDSLTWTLNRIGENIVELSKSLAGNLPFVTNPDDVVMLNDNIFVVPFVLNPIQPFLKKFGLNEFKKYETVRYRNDTAWFSLPGYQETDQVNLSGSFNNWSTMQHPMKRTAAGWEAAIRLAPGRYLYKFILDGRWIHDPYNRQKERDGQAGYNSIFYGYNYLFRLSGHTDARSVILTGSFNNWQMKQLKMVAVPGGWELPIYLEEGTYAYKFIVDGQWMHDPANPNVRADGGGNLNSFMGIGDTIVFRLDGYDSVKQVILAGSFNGWSTDELVMNKVPGGWELPYVLGKGYYEYKFIVDGKWMPDPANLSTAGSGDYTNSCLTISPNFTFRLSGFSDAQKVIVTGSFNGWQTESYRMTRQDDGWTFSFYLKPGKYTYKFIVDGTWLLDPANDVWEENREGTGNSVLWIEP